MPMRPPYPTAPHPKRSRIVSTARSAAKRAMPLLGRVGASHPQPKCELELHSSFSRRDTEIARSEMVFSPSYSRGPRAPAPRRSRRASWSPNRRVERD